MKSGLTQALVSALARDLKPVRPVPRLRVAAAAALLGWAVPALLWLGLAGARPDLAARALSGGGYASVLVGLILIGAGGVLAALAASVPGRERAAWAGAGIGTIGLVSALAMAPLLYGALGGAAAAVPILFCQLRAFAVALLPAAGVILFVRRGFPARPALVLAAAAAGAAGLGALPVHMSCPIDGALHAILGHALAPIAAALVALVSLPVALPRSAS